MLVGIKLVMGEIEWFKVFCMLIKEWGLSEVFDFIIFDSVDGGIGVVF